MQKLPIGIQSFRSLREGEFLYIDKTQAIYQLVNAGKYYFLSRPRRFGKSLTINTLAELFRGSKELFHGLWIEDKWDWNQKNPVIHIGFSSLGYKTIGLKEAITQRLFEEAQRYHLTLTKTGIDNLLRELIQKLHAQQGKVVILIDEYDKPIIDYLEEIEHAKQNRDILKTFYSVLKDADEQLRFVFLTGVSKFSKTSIFSELNNLDDLSMHPSYVNLLGYTPEELLHYFSDYIEHLAPKFKGKAAFLSKIKEWYNGYSWDGIHHVYNPFSILNFFGKGVFRNYWFESGTPTFLVKLLNRNQTYKLDHIQVGQAAFSSFELDRIDPIALLFQTGYITIQSVDEYDIYTLSYPNKEVRDSLLQYLLAEYTHEYPSTLPTTALMMKKALEQENLNSFIESLNSLFASIPYQLFINQKEAYYHSITYLALSLMGIYIQVEPSVSRGRPDAVVFTSSLTYLIEFKLDASAKMAIEQIKSKGYGDAVKRSEKKLALLGINFNSSEKKIDDWIVEYLH
ncbi:MAG: AAA family ATPase [Flammeovirgaceae bacterium]